ncbi:hypothetical protein HanXRQr2_Chr02g0052891 [Helianthus annuus]|uniref:Uncharacterized protein n=1 Tax=Helianthus annuus TaxID=4232 RepID=A0A9K3JM02_HELAN|nr:hypothetical protein HanXRQr2_Chr02g0052891 [Helianthus annuus]
MFGDVATRARRRVIKSGATRGLKERSKVRDLTFRYVYVDKLS